MASLDMKGPYSLTPEKIDEVVIRTSPGNYALGRNNDEDTFLVGYVGRSDSDVNDRLMYWARNSSRPLFKFSYAASAKSAFEKECRNYHDFNPPSNDVHPQRPDGKDWECPVCDIFN